MACVLTRGVPEKHRGWSESSGSNPRIARVYGKFWFGGGFAFVNFPEIRTMPRKNVCWYGETVS